MPEDSGSGWSRKWVRLKTARRVWFRLVAKRWEGHLSMLFELFL